MAIIERLFKGKGNNQSQETETVFTAKFEQEKQIVSALHMVGAGFETKGGCSLMLTEAVENGVDAIIKNNQKHKAVKGKINVHIDKQKNRILITDNGTGFLDIKHVCEKPFDSLKEADESQTGKFARGLQGFRAFCRRLVYVTRRLPEDIPEIEKQVIKGSNGSQTVQIEFIDNSGQAKVRYVDNKEFSNVINSTHGTIAIYENWKPGQFEKLNVTHLLRRLQHHFGELVRKGDVEIIVDMLEEPIQGIGPSQERYQSVEPRDYSEFVSIEINPVKYEGNGKKGEIKFNLFLSEKGRIDRWNSPYLLYQGRPVGDGFISEIDEFMDHPIWKHKFLTGYITCDFCEINELRQGLKNDTGGRRDFLFKELLRIEKFLEAKVKEHTKGLYELKLQKQVAELVKDLQLFFKNKNIFNFKIARSTGFLSKEDNEIEVVELATVAGTDANLEIKSKDGEGNEVAGSGTFENTEVTREKDGQEYALNNDVGGKGGIHAEQKIGSPGEEAKEKLTSTDKGFKESDEGYEKPSQDAAPHSIGGKEKANKKAHRHRPKGFGMVFQDDEFNEDMSWFDEVSSMIIINSQHLE